MNDQVILVNRGDKQIGTMEKMEAHKKAKLHRAFSVFIFNSKKQMLLQRRALGKYHCGGLWTNTCCSHPRPGEETIDAAHRRLKEEMGFDTELKEVTEFIYKAEFENGLTEYEYDHVFFGAYEGKIKPDKKEVCDWKYIDIDELVKDVKNNPDNYTPWFKIILGKVIKYAKKK
jgi:isopentenyl-diphosphate delta-isomerase